jgi:hypothetical protein
MAGRPRLYVSAAEKNQAYRQRQQQTTVVVDRWTFEQTEALLQRLLLTTEAAARRGHSLASSLDTRSRFDLLESLIGVLETPAKGEGG